MTDTTAEPITLEAFDPAELRIADNVRTDAEATITKEWVAQLKAHAAVDPTGKGCGNHTPVAVVRCPDGELEILFGARRTLGCIRAGVYLLGYIAGDKGDDQAARRARLIDQFTENVHREPMKRSDEAALILRLFDEEDMTEAGIARATGLSKPRVAAYRAVAGSKIAAKAADRWEFLTLDQAAVLAEFEGDEQAMTELVQAARQFPGQFDHVTARLRATRDEREARAAFVAELDAEGIAVYGEQAHVPWTLALENLRDGDGNDITPEAHAVCPGRAVTITYDWGWAPGAEAAYRAAHDLADDDDLADIEFDSDEEARAAGFVPGWQVGRYLCTDPEQYGHANVHGRPGKTQTQEQRTAEDEADEANRKSAERRRVIRRNKEWRAATEVRRRHLRDLLAAPRLPKALAGDGGPVARLRARAIARHETKPEMASWGHRVAAQLLGLGGSEWDSERLILEALDTAAPGRVPVIELAMVLGAAETATGGADGQDAETWRRAEEGWWTRGDKLPQQVRYLTWLAEHTGYPLSDIEAEVATRATPAAADDGDETAGDTGTGPDEADQDEADEVTEKN
jgi:ParB family transcriptional regulator, chromosome partitioning protein